MIGDALADPRLRDNLAVRDLDVRAYAGVPLTTSGGHTLGSFCVIDTQPRDWTEEEIATLRTLADSVQTEIELRGALRQARHGRRTFRVLPRTWRGRHGRPSVWRGRPSIRHGQRSRHGARRRPCWRRPQRASTASTLTAAARSSILRRLGCLASPPESYWVRTCIA